MSRRPLDDAAIRLASGNLTPDDRQVLESQGDAVTQDAQNRIRQHIAAANQDPTTPSTTPGIRAVARLAPAQSNQQTAGQE